MMKWLRGSCALSMLFVWFAASVSAAPQQTGNTTPEAALRQRVEKFYSLLEVGRYTEAEGYLTEESRADWRQVAKKRFPGFEFDSLKISPDGQSATVVVSVLTPTPYGRSFPFPQTTQWRLVKGAWYCDAQAPAAGPSLGDLKSGVGAPAANAPPAELKFKTNQQQLGGIERNQVKTAHFPFTNVSDHVVTIASVETYCKCLTLKTEKKSYKPGESGDLVIAFDPSHTDYEGYWGQTIIVKTDPGEVATRLDVEGFVALRPRPAAKTAQSTTQQPSSMPPKPRMKPGSMPPSQPQGQPQAPSEPQNPGPS